MKAEEEPLEKWEKEISKLCNKLMFFIYCVIGKFEEIREIVGFKKQKPKEDEIEKFIEICDNRIEGLKSFSKDLITSLSILVSFFGGILVGVLLKIKTGGSSQISLIIEENIICAIFKQFSLKCIFLCIIIITIIFLIIFLFTKLFEKLKKIKDENRKKLIARALLCAFLIILGSFLVICFYVCCFSPIIGLLLAIFSFGIVLFIVLAHYKAQTYAWYAIKEGLLLMKKNKKK